MNPITILTGARGAGKTTLLMKLVQQSQVNNIRAAGVISPAVFVGSDKTAIDLLNVAGGESRRLANLRQSESTGIMTERWVFEADTLEWGNRILASIPFCDLFLLDELGPIELERNQGLNEGIKALNQRNFKFGIVVIRPELIDKAIKLWPDADVISIEKMPGSLSSKFIVNVLNSIKGESAGFSQ